MPKNSMVALLYASVMLPYDGTAAEASAVDRAQVATSALLSVQLTGPKALAVRAAGQYVVQVQNDGPAAVPVEIEVRCPANLRVMASKPAATIDRAVLRWKLEAIPPKEKTAVAFDAVAESAEPVGIEVVVRPAVAVAIETPLRLPKLELTVRGPKSCEFGRPVVFTATVTNSGEAAVAKGGLQVFASRGVRVRPGDPRQGPFQLAPGQSLDTPIVLELTDDGPQGLKVQAEADDAPPATAEHRFLVRRPRIDVDLEGPGRLTVGQTADYRLTITNVGTSAIAKAYGFLELPENVALVAAAGDAIHDERRRLVYWPADGLEPRRRLERSLTLRAVRAGPLEIRGSAKETSGTHAESYVTGNVAAP